MATERAQDPISGEGLRAGRRQTYVLFSVSEVLKQPCFWLQASGWVLRKTKCKVIWGKVQNENCPVPESDLLVNFPFT